MATTVMTGATSGIGQRAALLLLRGPGVRLVVGARGDTGPERAELRRLDLASLASVREFAAGLADERIDALVLNGGCQLYSAAERSADGFELTFATNHLAHYLLARLLLPQVASGGRIIITSSGTHDPAEKTGVPPPRHAEAALLADPARDPGVAKGAMKAGMQAYSASKLCNLMTARMLAADPEVVRRGIAVHAYDPGFTPGTGLARATPAWFRRTIWPLLPLIVPLGKGMNSVANAGRALAGLADGSISDARVYMALRRGQPTWPEPSALARDAAAGQRLWDDSAEMVGVAA